jgi:hypothetical protein
MDRSVDVDFMICGSDPDGDRAPCHGSGIALLKRFRL